MTKWTKLAHKPPDSGRDVVVYCDDDSMHFAKYDKYLKKFIKDGVTPEYDSLLMNPKYWSERPHRPK